MKKDIESMFDALEEDFAHYSKMCQQILSNNMYNQNTKALIENKVNDATFKVCLTISDLSRMAHNFSEIQKQSFKTHLDVIQKTVAQIEASFLDKLNQSKNSIAFYKSNLKQVLVKNKFDSYKTNPTNKFLSLEKEV